MKVEFPQEVSTGQLFSALQKAAGETGGVVWESRNGGEKVLVLGSAYEETRGEGVCFRASIPFTGYKTRLFQAKRLMLSFSSAELKNIYNDHLPFDTDKEYEVADMKVKVQGFDLKPLLVCCCVPVVGWLWGIGILAAWIFAPRTRENLVRGLNGLSPKDQAKIQPFVLAFMEKVGDSLQPM